MWIIYFSVIIQDVMFKICHTKTGKYVCLCVCVCGRVMKFNEVVWKFLVFLYIYTLLYIMSHENMLYFPKDIEEIFHSIIYLTYKKKV